MISELAIGIAGNGVVDTDRDQPDLDARFARAKAAGFDYYEKSPPMGEIDFYLAASRRHDLPIRTTGFFYLLGRDEPLLDWNLRVSAQVGAVAHNVQVLSRDLAGDAVGDEQVADLYCRALDTGLALGVQPCFEVHVNMWSEHLGRVAKVGELVERRGLPFAITLDHSHVVFKIDNPVEQKIQDMDRDVAAGRLVLDPASPDSVARQWIERGWVRHAHARAAVPANPVNLWARHPNGTFGRGIQYPWIEPGAGEWHSAWEPSRLEPWKRIMRDLLAFHARDPQRRLGQITTEFIPATDYGAGARYSIFANNVAMAEWLRATWRESSATG